MNVRITLGLGALVVVLSLVGCGPRADRKPSKELVSQIERLLAKEPCVGDLDHWSRTYAYDQDGRARAVYPELVSFHLEEAGARGVEPGLHIADHILPAPDDKPIKKAKGHYDVPSEKLVFSYCGNNVGVSTRPTDINRMDVYYDDLRRRRAEIATMRR